MKRLLETELSEAQERNALRRKQQTLERRAKHPLAAWYAAAERKEKKNRVADEGKLGAALAARMPDAKQVVALNEVTYERLSNGKTGLKRYGLSYDEWTALVEAHKSCCAICGEFADYAPSLCVDHCHKTNKVRGLLCRKCNTAIGQLNDDPAVLRKAADYLERS